VYGVSETGSLSEFRQKSQKEKSNKVIKNRTYNYPLKRSSCENFVTYVLLVTPCSQGRNMDNVQGTTLHHCETPLSQTTNLKQYCLSYNEIFYFLFNYILAEILFKMITRFFVTSHMYKVGKISLQTN
jgi:hypothetical protein